MRQPWMLLALTFVALVAVAEKAPRRKPAAAAAAPLNQREQALQMLNRFTFGPRPGEVDQVMADGTQQWFERQLKPQAIADGVLASRLKAFPTLTMTAAQVLLTFPDRNTVAQIADGKRPAPTDPLLAHLYEVLVYKYKAEQNNTAPEPTDAEKAKQLAEHKQADEATAARIAGQLLALPKQKRMEALNAFPPADRIAFATSLNASQRNLLQADFTPRERETMQAMQYGINSAYRAQDELAQARVLRDILSERELEQVMTAFWFNHFNVFMPKDSDEWYTTAYERDAIRAHALGHFRDLLLATAQSPAMLVYLDNWLSVGPDSPANGVDAAKPNSKPGRKGLNENYGREVMELHTLGVNGGYTQADVTQLAAILTGWTIDKPGLGGPFLFDPKKHEPGVKQWFGYTLGEDGAVLAGPARTAAVAHAIAAEQGTAGMKQGLTALILLAASPRTAHFISYKLAQSFLADDPPSAIVDRMAAAYLDSDGDIAALLRALVQSPEFNSRKYFRNKVKLPEEFLSSIFRATATEPQYPDALVNELANQFGEPLYKALPPTGYYITADHWMNTQSLMGRLNFADQLTHNKFSNQKFDSTRVLALSLLSDRGEKPVGYAPAHAAARPVAYTPDAGSDVALRVLEKSLIGAQLSSSTANFIQTQLAQQPVSDVTAALNLITALLLGSPEFQVH